IVTSALEKEIAPCDIAHWHKPNGGYFVSLYAMPGTARRVGELCKAAGVTLTNVGATYPHGIDPDDSNIRIAPSYPTKEDLRAAMEVLCVCVKLAAAEKLLEK
ncbi:MAG: aminotransferase, partial [Clostridiales bacterium]|nr:aminotransferase [Clostridiales bacterium]